MSRRKDRRPSLAAPPRELDRQAWAFGGLLVVLTLAVYAQTLWFGFITIDDSYYAAENPRIQLGLSPAGVVWSFTTVHDANWIPLTWLSLMLDTSLFGFRPAGYHLTNVLLHAANTVLLFAALLAATDSRGRSAFVAALFALHPLHVESVAWIAERKDVLSTFFGLLATLTYVLWAKRAQARWLVAAVLCFVASLMAKQTLVTLPFVLLLLDFWPLGRLRAGIKSAPPQSAEPRNEERAVNVQRPQDNLANAPRTARRLLAEKIPFFAVAIAFSAIALFAQKHGGGVKNLADFPFRERLLNALVVYVAYLGKIFWPFNLAIYYPHPHAELSLMAATLSALLLLATSAVAIVCARRRPYVLVGWCWYLGTLVPMIGLVQVGTQQMADRYTYFPAIGIFLAVTWLICDLATAGVSDVKKRAIGVNILRTVAAVATVLLAFLAYRQVRYWHDSATLLRHSQESTVENRRAHQLLGSALIEAGATSEGIAELETAVRMDESSPAAHSALGAGLQTAGRPDEAAAHYERALALNGPDPDVFYNLARIQIERHDYKTARQNLLHAVDINPDHVDAYTWLGTADLELGDYRETITASQRALSLNPKSIRARHNLAIALMASGRLDDAIRQFETLVSLLPDDAEARQNLDRARALKNGAPSK
jgi:protein O-mannosyl-transferase